MRKPDHQPNADEARKHREARREQHEADVASVPALIEAELAQARRPDKMQHRRRISRPRPTVH